MDSVASNEKRYMEKYQNVLYLMQSDNFKLDKTHFTEVRKDHQLFCDTNLMNGRSTGTMPGS